MIKAVERKGVLGTAMVMDTAMVTGIPSQNSFSHNFTEKERLCFIGVLSNDY